MHVQGHRLDLKPRLLPLATPLQPRLVTAEGVGKKLGFVGGKGALAGGGEEFGEFVLAGGVTGESASGLAQSKSYRPIRRPRNARSVLDCGSPLPLFGGRRGWRAAEDGRQVRIVFEGQPGRFL